MENLSMNSLTEVDADNVVESAEMVTASLFEVMTSRNRFMTEKELWAVCRECCLTLEYVYDCHDLFQSLCISPDTVAFDPEGNLCFLDLDTEPESVYLPPEFTSGRKTYKTHLYSLGMTLLFATEYNNSSNDPEAVLSDTFTKLLTTITHEDSERRPELHTVLGACEKALEGESSQEICMQILGSQSRDSPVSRGTESRGSFQEMANDLAAYLESQTDLVQSGNSDTVCTDNEGNIQTGKHGKRISATPDTSNHTNKDINDNSLDTIYIPLVDLLASLYRRIDESELWSICRECVLCLQRRSNNCPEYISLETVMITATGSICIKALPEQKPLEDMYLAPELRLKGIPNEKTCLYGLGISLQTAAGFNNSSYSTSNMEALEILITSFIHDDPDMRPDLDTAFEMCEEYEKVSKTSSQQVCLQLFEEAMKTSGSFSDIGSEKMKKPSAVTVEYLVANGSTKDENNIAEVPHYTNQKSTQTLSSRPMSACKATDSAVAGVTHPQPSSAFKHVVAGSKLHDMSRIPTAFSSPATHFKPIVIHSASTGTGNSDQLNTCMAQTVKDSQTVDRNIQHNHPENNISDSSDKDLREFERTSDRFSVGRKQISDVNTHTNNTEQMLNQLQSHRLTMDSATTSRITEQRNRNDITNTGRDLSLTNSSMQMSSIVPPFSTKSQSRPQQIHFSLRNIPHSFQNMHPNNQTLINTAASNAAPFQHPAQLSSHNMSTLQGSSVGTENSCAILANSVSNNPAGEVPLMQGHPFYLPTAGTKNHSDHYMVPFSGYSHTNWPLQYTLVPDATSGFMQMLPVQYIPFSHMQTSQDTPRVFNLHADRSRNSLPMSGNQTYNTGDTETHRSPRFPQESHYFGTAPNRRLSPHNIHQYNDRSHVHDGFHSAGKISASLKQVSKTSVDHQQEEDNMQSTSTSPSKDSGIYVNQQSENMNYCIDKLGHADRVLSNVLHILQDTFAADPSLDLGIDGVSMGKYVMSLTCLTWDTFCHAVMEKFVHLAWSYEVLSKLYVAIGGHQSSELKHYTESSSKDYHKSQYRQKTEHRQSEFNDKTSDGIRNQDSVHKQLQGRQGKHQINNQEQQHRFSRQQSSSYNPHQHVNKHLSSQHGQGYQRPQMSHNKQEVFNQHAAGSQKQPVFNHNFPVTAAMPVPSLHSLRKSPTDHRPRSEMKKQKYLWGEPIDNADSEMRPEKQPFQKACELNTTKRSVSLHNINFTGLSTPAFKNIDIDKHQEQQVNYAAGVSHNNQTELTKDYCNSKQSYSNIKQNPSDVYENDSTYDERRSANSQIAKVNRPSKDGEQISMINLDSAYEAAKFTETRDGYNSPSSLLSHSSSSRSDGSKEHKHVSNKPMSSLKNKLQYVADSHSLSGVVANALPLQSSHTHSAPPAIDLPVNRNHTDYNHVRSQVLQHSKPNNSREQWTESGHQNSHGGTNCFHNAIENQPSTITRPLSETILDYYKPLGQKQHNPSASNELYTVSSEDLNYYPNSKSYLPTEVREERKLGVKKTEPYNNRCEMELPVSQEMNKKMRTERFTLDSSRNQQMIRPESSVCDKGHQKSKHHQTSDSSRLSPNYDFKLSDSSQAILMESENHLTSSRTQDRNIDDNSRKTPAYSRSLSATYFRQSNQQPRGITVLPSETELYPDACQRRGSDGSVQLSGVNIKLLPYIRKSNVVYHSAMVQLNLTSEVNAFIHSVDEENRAAIEKSLASINQEIAVQRRERLKTQKLFRKLNDQMVAGKKGDQNVVEQMVRDMTDMTRKLSFLYLCQTHYQMLLAELHGLDASLLYSLAVCEGNSVLSLQPVTRNPHLQFRVISALDGEQMTVLQAGTPRGLMSYLYTSSALSIGFIHQFLLCFRYILTADQLLTFIIEKYNSARRNNQKDVNIVCIQCRSTDLLHFWLEGFYSIDFAPNKELVKKFADFLAEQTNANMECTDSLFSLYAACRMGENTELMHMAEINQDDTEDGAYIYCMGVPKRWDSFRSLLKRSRSDKSNQGSNSSFGKGRSNIKTLSPEQGKASPFSLADCPAHVLAEQLTLMEQELFRKCHPVHYLNSQFQGVGVALSMPGLRTPSMSRKSEAIQGPKKGLFVGEPPVESYVVKMINHSQELAHWVSAEILSSGSSKAQINLITKFLTAAHLCIEVRNYATALSILDGLENLVIRQLPAWKNSPAKSLTYMDELTDIKIKLKSEALWLMKDKDWHTYPTIPCALFFALHIQQAEIGSFTLANGMYKWDKMRSITDLVDQLRIFRDHSYGFQPDFEIQRFLHRCLAHYSDQDLHVVASTHDSNFHKHSSSTSLSGTLKKVRRIFKKKA